MYLEREVFLTERGKRYHEGSRKWAGHGFLVVLKDSLGTKPETPESIKNYDLGYEYEESLDCS